MEELEKINRATPGITVNSGDLGSCVHTFDCIHSREIRAERGVDLKASPNPYTNPSTQAESLPGISGLNTTYDQTVTEQ